MRFPTWIRWKGNEIFERFLGVSDYYSVLADAGYEFTPVSIGG